MIASDLSILFHLLRGQSKNGTHAERLQAFYAPQAGRYDAFRERLLSGRQNLIEQLEVPEGGRVVELGGGTGHNLLYFGERLKRFNRVEVVDLCPALLNAAERRLRDLPNVSFIEADATVWQPDAPVDCVYFSYALTMIPDWRAAIDNAIRMLAPGGILAVVDFYVSADQASSDMLQHKLLTRMFWPKWFAHDGVHLNPAHLQQLRKQLPEHRFYECSSKVPYMAGLRVPYYQFIGRRCAIGEA